MFFAGTWAFSHPFTVWQLRADVTLRSGGSDTAVSAIHTLILAMVSFPEIQAKAQKELDLVIGSKRLPEYSDEADLPYISAIVKEVLRCVLSSSLSLFRGAHRPSFQLEACYPFP